MAEVLAAQAALAASRGQLDPADRKFAEAVAVSDRGEFAVHQVMIRLEHAELLVRMGRVADAARLRAEIEGIAPPPFGFLPERRAALARALERERA